MFCRSVTANPFERARRLPGDDLTSEPMASLTHAMTMRCPRQALWPWLAQMGAGRAGWYSYDFIDNGRQPSETRVVPELQEVTSGMIFPALPGVTDGFTVLAFEPERLLILGWLSSPDGLPLVTWAFVLEDSGHGGTRLIVSRARRTWLPVPRDAVVADQAHRAGDSLHHAAKATTRDRSTRRGAGCERRHDKSSFRRREDGRGMSVRFSPGRWLAAPVGLAAGAYAAYVATAWCRYGHAAHPARPDEQDDLLDRFMPTYEVTARHRIRVAAPAEITLAAACEMDLLHSPIVRATIKMRELVLGATADDRPRPTGLVAEVQSLGWGVLAEIPGRAVVVGAVTQPWKADVVFRALPPDEFAAFREPGYAKIVWTLRADPTGARESVFSTETRVLSTDGEARRRFRWYWSFFSPGMMLIRWLSLGPLKTEAERRARGAEQITSTL